MKEENWVGTLLIHRTIHDHRTSVISRTMYIEKPISLITIFRMANLLSKKIYVRESEKNQLETRLKHITPASALDLISTIIVPIILKGKKLLTICSSDGQILNVWRREER